MARTIALWPKNSDDDEDIFVIAESDLIDPLHVAFQRGWISYRRADNGVTVHLSLSQFDAIHEREV